ncbi:NACHT domain-containing protein [Streptomyces avicenniae]|uniref:NACHT domain-containing protein n=1 Tax=Streptomyces avicenniae TaxID=500153 RepID=UPI00069B1A60|nr:NACHT domain-containing protein [Streptomyces avicenniae]
MRAGRPPSAESKRLPELEAIADWFVSAIDGTGHGSIRRTAEMTGLNPRALYDVVNAGRMLPLPVVRSLAEGLGRDADAVTPLWAQAKRERDRIEEDARRDAHPGTANWSEIPLPSPALRDILEAQDGILDCLPYSVLGLMEPPLSAVYVRQRVRHSVATPRSGGPATDDPPDVPGSTQADEATPPRDGHAAPGARPGADGEAGSPTAERVMSLPDALARYEHLLITGEAGAGKSTLAGHLVRSLCGVWLRRSSFQDAPVTEPLVPLRLSASLLAGAQGSWSERLRSAALATLGGSLVADPPAALFAGRAQGARWLVFVDGLDEIADRRERGELIRTLARHSRRDSAFRLVVTTRPLPPAELAPLREALPGGFEIQPFGEPELRDYARKWFDQQRAQVPHPAAAADRFVAEVVEEGELTELVRNPLLATLALVNATLEPSLPPASGRLALYESFLDRLRDRAGGAGGAAPFPGRLAGSADALLRHVARLRTEGDEDLAAAAREWVRRHAVADLPAGWEAELPAALAGTGLLVVAGEQVRFLHQSFAEFLAAVSYAEEIPADGEGLERWIRRACDEAQRSLALFVLCRWATSPGGSADVVIERALARPDSDRTLAAAALLSEGAEAGADQVTRVVERLAAHVRGGTTSARRAAVALGALGVRHDTAPVLRLLAAAPDVTAGYRFRALSALSRLIPPTETTALFRPLLLLIRGFLPLAARLAEQLGEPSVRAVRERIGEFLEEPGAGVWQRRIAAEAYRVLGAADEAERLARRVVADPLAGHDNVKRAAEAWLGSDPAPTVCAQLAEAGAARPAADHAGRMAVAQVLEEAGATSEAAELARSVLDDRRVLTWDQQEAARLWLAVRGADDAGPVRELAAFAEETGWETWRVARLLRLMTDAGVDCEALAWTRQRLGGTGELPLGRIEVVRLWCAARGPSDGPELTALVGDGRRLHPLDRADYAEALLDEGLHEDAWRTAELALRSPSVLDSDCCMAAAVLLRVDRGRAVKSLAEQADGCHGTGAWGAGVLEALEEDGAEDLDALRLRIATYVLGLAGVKGAHVEAALDALLSCGDPRSTEEAVALVCTHPALTLRQRSVGAQVFAEHGQVAAALEIWRHVLRLVVTETTSEAFGMQVLEDIAELLTFVTAERLVREVSEEVGSSLSTFHRRRFTAMLGWLAGGPSLA